MRHPAWTSAPAGRTFEHQLEELERFWSEDSAVGPPTARGGRPELLMGGGADVVYRRAARYADGWTFGGGPPEFFAEAVVKLNAEWQKAGREAEPRKVALMYYALGSDPEGQAQNALGDYYSFLGDYADQIVGGAAKDADTVKGYLQAFEQAGADEVICFPTSPDPEQVDLLAKAAGL